MLCKLGLVWTPQSEIEFFGGISWWFKLYLNQPQLQLRLTWSFGVVLWHFYNDLLVWIILLYFELSLWLADGPWSPAKCYLSPTYQVKWPSLIAKILDIKYIMSYLSMCILMTILPTTVQGKYWECNIFNSECSGM